ncbi:MAG: type I-E CRISPR-associated protein Cas7/Cse4/CasC [Pseudomonadota bacterium]
MSNPFAKTIIEFHILQSFPVTCLNRDDIGAPKRAIVGGVERARVSSQCWKRQVRLALHDLGIKLGMRTRKITELIFEACKKHGASPEKAEACANTLSYLYNKKTKNKKKSGSSEEQKKIVHFITSSEVESLAQYAQEKDFVLPDEIKKDEAATINKKIKKFNGVAQYLDLILFGRMVAQTPEFNIQAASSFSHAISTHKVSNELDFFTAVEELESCGSAHMGHHEYNSATYYRYINLNLGELWEALGEDMPVAVEAFVKALYIAVPSARQTTQSGACPWEYARILVRRGQGMQASFDKAVRAKDGYLEPSKVALNDFINRQEQLSGSLYGKQADFTFGDDMTFSIDALCEALCDIIAQGGQA